MFATSVPTTIPLKNVSFTLYNEVKLISTSSSIILTLIQDTKVHEQLELVHKALINGTSFWINLEVILNVSFTFFSSICNFFRKVGLLLYFSVEVCKNILYIPKLFVQILGMLTMTFWSVAPFKMVCKNYNFTNLKLLINSLDYYCSSCKGIWGVSRDFHLVHNHRDKQHYSYLLFERSLDWNSYKYIFVHSTWI